MSNFTPFAQAVRTRFAEMSKEQLFVVDSDREAIWQTYLISFPFGSNPMFRKRTEHDCSCCRAFVRNVGSIVAIQNGALSSVWDLNGLPEPYQSVADGMAAYVKSRAIRDVFLTKMRSCGVTKNREMLEDKSVMEWTHFSTDFPEKFINADFVAKQGEYRTTFEVFLRGLVELEPEALTTVVELIESKALYRGEEHLRSVKAFQQLQNRLHNHLGDPANDHLIWSLIDQPVARFRNTVIGTLVQDLSAGVDLEMAVRSFEKKVAPENYKRPTALITPSMIKVAMQTIQELDLEPALERRHARLSDVSVNSVLFVDNTVRGKMKGGVEGLLMEEVKPPPFDPKKAEEVDINYFLRVVVPKTRSIKLYLEDRHQANLVSMTAPVHANPETLFRWDNDFAWSYNGNVTDSIKDKVKRAGGKVEGIAMRVSLAWYNTDDLDLHVVEPNGNHIYFFNKCGKLDVDMNVNQPVRDAVENIRWIMQPAPGVYQVYVRNYTKRESIDVGFTVEIESAAGLHTLRYEKALPSQKMQPVATIHVGRNGTSITADSALTAGSISQEVWGLKTLDLVRVNSIVLSPNHWEAPGSGNRHWFFLLEGCKNPDPVRGLYNEFLSAKLDKHRKVFEVLADKTKCPVTNDQLSGVGFSSTRGDKVTVLAMGPGFQRTYTIAF